MSEEPENPFLAAIRFVQGRTSPQESPMAVCNEVRRMNGETNIPRTCPLHGPMAKCPEAPPAERKPRVRAAVDRLGAEAWRLFKPGSIPEAGEIVVFHARASPLARDPKDEQDEVFVGYLVFESDAFGSPVVKGIVSASASGVSTGDRGLLRADRVLAWMRLPSFPVTSSST